MVFSEEVFEQAQKGSTGQIKFAILISIQNQQVQSLRWLYILPHALLSILAAS